MAADQPGSYDEHDSNREDVDSDTDSREEEESKLDDSDLGESDSDDSDLSDGEKLKPLQYLSDCPKPPTDRPPGYSHIIKTAGFNEETDPKGLRLAPGVGSMGSTGVVIDFCGRSFARQVFLHKSGQPEQVREILSC